MKQKRCPKCGHMKPLSEFYKNKWAKDGYQHWCATCLNRRASKYEKANPEKVRVKTIVNSAIKRGDLVRGSCEVCGSNQNVDGHHDDYSKPLDVRWLCRSCHFKHHRNQRSQA